MSSDKAALVRAARGPVLLITLGLLFVSDHMGPFPFYKTWPVLLIVYGLMKLVERTLAREDAGAAAAGGSV